MVLLLSGHVEERALYMRPEVEEILLRVAEAHHVSPLDVARGRRSPKTVLARYEWLREVKKAFGYSYPETAEATGTDHTTVIRACRKKK